MIENYPKCCQCKELKKEEDLLAYYVNNCKFTICKKCFEKNLPSNPQSFPDNPVKDNSNLSQFSIILKKEDKKLDLNEPIKKNDDLFLLNKKRRFTKKIIFKRKKIENNLDKFEGIIYKIINALAEKSKLRLIITSKSKEKCKNKICYICKRKKLTKSNKMIKFMSLNDIINVIGELYNSIEQEENKQLLINNSQIKYNQILEQKKNYLNMKSIIKGQDLPLNKRGIICFFCIYQLLINNNLINTLWEKVKPFEDKKEKQNTEVFTGFESILISNNNKNNANVFNESQIKEENNESDKNNTLDEDLNLLLNDKNANIFDLILGDEEEGEINDIDNNSDENKSTKNKNNNIINNNDSKRTNEAKKDKKIKKMKINTKENKILFKKTIEMNNGPNQFSNMNKMNVLNNNINLNNPCIGNLNNINNNVNNNNCNVNDRNKNINIINMNNINNINQFNEPNYINKNTEPIQPLYYNIKSTPSPANQPNSLYNSNLINNNSLNNLGFLNNSFTPNEESIYDRLSNQLGSLKTKLNLISNLNNSRIANSSNLNNDLQVIIANNSFKEYLSYFQNSMHLISNYMNNISDMLEKYSCINENSLSLMNSMIQGTISTQNIMQLKNNNNHFSQLLNYNYNIQKMNTELCDIINKHLNHS